MLPSILRQANPIDHSGSQTKQRHESSRGTWWKVEYWWERERQEKNGMELKTITIHYICIQNSQRIKNIKIYFFLLLKIYNKILLAVTLLINESLYPGIHSSHAHFFCSYHPLVTITLCSPVIATFAYSIVVWDHVILVFLNQKDMCYLIVEHFTEKGNALTWSD